MSQILSSSFLPPAERTIDAGPMHLISSAPPTGTLVEAPGPEYSLTLVLRTGPLVRLGFNRPPRWLAVAPGSMMFTPPDTSCEWMSDPGHCLCAVIPKARAEEFVQETGARVDLREEEAFREPRLAEQVL